MSPSLSAMEWQMGAASTTVDNEGALIRFNGLMDFTKLLVKRVRPTKKGSIFSAIFHVYFSLELKVTLEASYCASARIS